MKCIFQFNFSNDFRTFTLYIPNCERLCSLIITVEQTLDFCYRYNTQQEVFESQTQISCLNSTFFKTQKVSTVQCPSSTAIKFRITYHEGASRNYLEKICYCRTFRYIKIPDDIIFVRVIFCQSSFWIDSFQYTG